MVTEKRKIKGIVRVVKNPYNIMYNPELIVKEVMHANNYRRFRDSISLKERLSTAKIFIVL